MTSPSPRELESAIAFWVRSAKENLAIAESMCKSKRYNFVMFMCHQTLEAVLKEVYVASKKERPPFLHKLPRLLFASGLSVPDKVDLTLLQADAHYIKARYIQDRFDTKVYNAKNAAALLKQTRETLKWFLDRIG